MEVEPMTTPRESVAAALFANTAGGSSGLDDMLAAMCEGEAVVAIATLRKDAVERVLAKWRTLSPNAVWLLEDAEAAVDAILGPASE